MSHVAQMPGLFVRRNIRWLLSPSSRAPSMWTRTVTSLCTKSVCFRAAAIYNPIHILPKMSRPRRSLSSSIQQHELSTENYDIIIVGFGIAGACAAISAAEKGVTVLILDRSGRGGGASALSGGIVYAGGGTPYQKAAGYDDTPENMFNYLHQEVNGVVDDETLKAFCDNSVSQLAWLEQHGAKFESSMCEYKTTYPTDRHYMYWSGNEKAYPYNLKAKPAPRGHRQVAKGLACGNALWESLRKSALDLGVRFQPYSRVQELILEENKVTGVHCNTLIGDERGSRLYKLADAGKNAVSSLPAAHRAFSSITEYIWQHSATSQTFRAKAVILSAGGFAFNRELLMKHLPRYEHIMPLGTEGDDGSGIHIGQMAGGTVGSMDKMTAWRFLSPPSAFIEGIVVGQNGDRVINEDVYGATLAEELIHKHDGCGYLILDSNTWQKAKSQVNLQADYPMRLQALYLVNIGHIKANTLEELCRKINVSETGLQQSVIAYNEAITSGKEDPQMKARELCTPIAEGPFYAIDISIRPHPIHFVPGLTLGGLKVCGKSGLVLNESGETISGLYAAGRNAVGICSNSYVSGLSIADGMFSGRRAGEHAASMVIPHG